MSQNKIISKKNMLMLGIILIVCLGIGSICDYNLSLAIFNKENLFGNILAAYGQLPTSAALSVAGVLLIYTVDHQKKLNMILSYVGGFLLNVFALFMGVMEPTMYFPNIHVAILAVITILLFVLINAIILRLVSNANDKDIRRFVGFIVFVVFVQIIVINVIKVPWGRPRMRMISETPGASFQSWWVIGSSMKTELMALGVASEEFKSFPSGHTASAACSMIICVLPLLNDKLKAKSNLLFWGAALFTAIVAFSRIIMGAHFLSDVTVGFSVCFLVLVLAVKIFYNNRLRT